MKKPKISLCMIVKDESQWIGQCLKSVADWVDEMIVVDTGSTDATVEIARNMGAQIHYQAWENDFAKARNYSLSKATGEWILVLDADETLGQADKEEIERLVREGKSPIYYLLQTTYCEESATLGWIPNNLEGPESKGYPGYIESSLARLFRNTGDVAFEGCIHEHAHHSDSRIRPVMTKARIHHYGKYSPKEAMDRKTDLYLKLGLEKCRQKPENAHAWYELGVQYWFMGEEEKALEAFETSSRLDPNYVRPIVALGGISTSQKAYPKALRYYSRVMDAEPENIMPYLYLPTILIEMGNVKLAQEILRYGQRFALGHPPFHINKGIVQQYLGNHRAAIECFECALKINPAERLAIYNTGLSHAALGEFDQALSHYRRVMDDPKIGLLARKKTVELFYERDLLDEALKEAEAAADKFGMDGELAYQKAVIYLKMGDKAQAREALAGIQDYAIFDATGLANFKQCLLLLGENARAREVEDLMVRRSGESLKENTVNQ